MDGNCNRRNRQMQFVTGRIPIHFSNTPFQFKATAERNLNNSMYEESSKISSGHLHELESYLLIVHQNETKGSTKPQHSKLQCLSKRQSNSNPSILNWIVAFNPRQCPFDCYISSAKQSKIPLPLSSNTQIANRSKHTKMINRTSSFTFIQKENEANSN